MPRMVRLLVRLRPRVSGPVTPGGNEGDSLSPFAAEPNAATEKVAR